MPVGNVAAIIAARRTRRNSKVRPTPAPYIAQKSFRSQNNFPCLNELDKSDNWKRTEMKLTKLTKLTLFKTRHFNFSFTCWQHGNMLQGECGRAKAKTSCSCRVCPEGLECWNQHCLQNATLFRCERSLFKTHSVLILLGGEIGQNHQAHFVQTVVSKQNNLATPFWYCVGSFSRLCMMTIQTKLRVNNQDLRYKQFWQTGALDLFWAVVQSCTWQIRIKFSCWISWVSIIIAGTDFCDSYILIDHKARPSSQTLDWHGFFNTAWNATKLLDHLFAFPVFLCQHAILRRQDFKTYLYICIYK